MEFRARKSVCTKNKYLMSNSINVVKQGIGRGSDRRGGKRERGSGRRVGISLNNRERERSGNIFSWKR